MNFFSEDYNKKNGNDNVYEYVDFINLQKEEIYDSNRLNKKHVNDDKELWDWPSDF